MKMNISKYVAQVQLMANEGSSKAKCQDEIATMLEDDGIKAMKIMTLIPKIFKDSGVKFRKAKGNTWRELTVEALIENPDLTREEMREICEESGMADPDYYVKTWYHIFTELSTGLIMKMAEEKE